MNLHKRRAESARPTMDRLTKHEDSRGYLLEVLRDDQISEDMKQVYFSISKPGVIRGNHYHKRKTEWFSVTMGTGILTTLDALKRKDEFVLTGDEPAIVRVPPHTMHTIKNTGEEDMLLIVVADEVFDPEDSDTYPFDPT